MRKRANAEKSIAKQIKKILSQRDGTTMVELIMSFLLLAIFLVAVTMVITNALKTYYGEQRNMSIFSVADSVTSELKEDISRMQASSLGGFVKVRGLDKATVPATAGNQAKGITLEFIKVNEKDGLILEQLDTLGCYANTTLITATGVKKSSLEMDGRIPKDQLTARYYLRWRDEEQAAYDGKFMDEKSASSSTALATCYDSFAVDTPVVWDAENKLPAAAYLGYPIWVTYTLEPYDDGSGTNTLLVSYVKVKVQVLSEPAPDADGDGIPEEPDPGIVLYSKETTINLQNEVQYNNEKTLYSEVTP